MTEEVQKELFATFLKLNKASAEIESLAIKYKLPKLLELTDKCEREVERPMQVLIDSLGH